MMKSEHLVPTLCVGMPVLDAPRPVPEDAERPGMHSHAERGNEKENNS